MTISKHEVTARVYTGDSYVDLPVSDGNIEMRADWMPFITGTIVVPLSDAVMSLDPRQSPPPRVYVTATQTFGTSKKASELSARNAGNTAADMSSQWVGMTGEWMSEMYFQSWNLPGYGVEGSTSRNFNLTLRSREVNYKNQTVTLQLASDEALLEDYALVRTVPWVLQSQSIRTIVSMVLDHLGFSLSPGAADGVIEDVSASWEPGQTAWDFLQPMVQASNLRLWADGNRLWTLESTQIVIGGHVDLSTDTNLTDVSSDISREGDWYDAVVVKYTWDDTLGVQQTRYDVAQTSPTPTKVLSLSYETQYPGPGAAGAVLARKQQLGEVIPVQSVAAYDVEPGWTFYLNLPGQATRFGSVNAVEWRWPEDTMSITTKDIELA